MCVRVCVCVYCMHVYVNTFILSSSVSVTTYMYIVHLLSSLPSQCLHISYTSVVTSDPYSILTQVLSSHYTDRYQLAKKFVTDCNLKSKEVRVL